MKKIIKSVEPVVIAASGVDAQAVSQANLSTEKNMQQLLGESHETEDVNFWEWDYISENLNKHRGGRSYSISIQYSW